MAAPVATPVPSLLEALRSVPDGRKRRGRRYRQASMLTFAVCAMRCGARSVYAIAQLGRDQAADDIRAALAIGRASTPSVATLFRLFRDLDVTAFAQALAITATASFASVRHAPQRLKERGNRRGNGCSHGTDLSGNRLSRLPSATLSPTIIL